MNPVGATLGLAYLSPEEFAALPDAARERMLGAISFSSRALPLSPGNIPSAQVDMPVLGSSGMIEVWLSEQPVLRESAAGISIACNQDMLFGCLSVDDDIGLDAASRHAYDAVYDTCLTREYPHLLRVWNYFPRINADENGLERYRKFNIGRHDAFNERKQINNHIPAACALGSCSGKLVVYFLAAKNYGVPIENPGQTSAYRYPPQYGPRSPLFSRAMLAHTDGGPLLFISGTASIVGHETLHAGDAQKQAAQTVRNLLAVIERAQSAAPKLDWSRNTLLLKAYVRHPEHQGMLRQCLRDTFGEAMRIVCLQADICRSDLLMEVEGAYLERSRVPLC